MRGEELAVVAVRGGLPLAKVNREEVAPEHCRPRRLLRGAGEKLAPLGSLRWIRPIRRKGLGAGESPNSAPDFSLIFLT